MDAAVLVELHQGKQRRTNDFAGCFHDPVELLLFVSTAAPKPGSGAVCKDAFDGAPVEGGEVRSGETCLSEPLEGVERPLGFFDDCCGVSGEGHFLSQMDTQELDIADPLHSSTMDV